MNRHIFASHPHQCSLCHRTERAMANTSTWLAVVLAVLLSLPAGAAGALDTVFTYQGSVEQAGSLVNGACDFQFRLFSAPSGGSQIGGTQSRNAVTVVDGVFTVLLDSAGAFTGDDRYLDISVRCPAGSGSFVALTPRQQLTAAPYAFFTPDAASASDLTCTACVSATQLAPAAVTNDKVASGIAYSKLAGTPTSLPPSGNAGGSLVGTYPNPSLGVGVVGQLNIAAGAVSSGQIQDGGILSVDLGDGAVTSQKIAPSTIQTGNLAFTPGTVTSIATGTGLMGGTITTSGTIAADIGTTAGTVAAGDHNHDGTYWSLGGNGLTGTEFLGTTNFQALEFRVNSTRALRLEPSTNSDPNASSPNVIGGSPANSHTGQVGVTIGGGGTAISPNHVQGDYGTVGGGRGNQAADTATIGGGQENAAGGFAATVGGGLGNGAAGLFSAVGGGTNNDAGGTSVTIAGGSGSSATAAFASIGGGSANAATGEYASVGGGQSNQAAAKYATIGGGGQTDPNDSITANRVLDDYGTVGGGGNNQAGNNVGDTTDAVGATVGGGGGNLASGPHATVSGGFLNFATGPQSTVAGGTINSASGQVSTVAGGSLNSADGFGSFAAGVNAHATHNGSFVWGDGTRIAGSQGANTFNVLATGGIRFYIDGVGGHCDLTSTGGWTCSGVSDRNAKAGFAVVKGRDVVARLAKIPIQTWSYKAQPTSVRHIGPMAQDFRTAFHVGEDDTHINTVDADGVALAAIQGLYEMAQESAHRIARLEAQNAALHARLAEFENTVHACADGL